MGKGRGRVAVRAIFSDVIALRDIVAFGRASISAMEGISGHQVHRFSLDRAGGKAAVRGGQDNHKTHCVGFSTQVRHSLPKA